MGNNKKEINKTDYDLLLFAGIISVIYGTGITLLVCSTDKRKEYYYYNTVVVTNGELSTNYDNLSTEPHKEDYEVVHQDDNSLVIFIYGDDHGKRYMYTNYIVDNIDLEKNEDGTYTINFDEDNITDANYLLYVNNIEKDEKGVERKRK